MDLYKIHQVLFSHDFTLIEYRIYIVPKENTKFIEYLKIPIRQNKHVLLGLQP